MAASTYAISYRPLLTEALIRFGASGDTVDWGHLRAGDQQYGDGQKQYDLLGDEVLALPVPPPPPMPAAGDGLPHQHNPQQAEIGSVEEALAILLKHKQSSKKKDHKEKKAKKAKEKEKGKKQKKKKSKKDKQAADASTDSD